MTIGIIDADLVNKKKHRFPNLACMKISSFHKKKGDTVSLLFDYEDIGLFDKVYISKVFTDTSVPKDVLTLNNVEYGGSGFYYPEESPMLQYEIEHSFPDYDLYKPWVEQRISEGDKPSNYKYYLKYSIGYTTRGCFRHCDFCVNKYYNKVERHSDIDEFLDVSRPKICLLDDNFFGYAKWKDILNEIIKTNKPFQFKQGLDERLIDDEKCKILFNAKYDGDFIFAFDDIKDKDIIISKLHIIKKYTKKIPKFYVFCGFDREKKWDNDFWEKDIFDLYERIKILMSNHCLPYIMRFNRYVESPYKGIYITLARWCNQPSMFKKKSFREYVNLTAANGEKASYLYMKQIEMDFPEIASTYFDIKWEMY